MSDFDVVIVGGGPVGIVLGAALARRWGDGAARIALIDAKPIEAVMSDPRTLALADTSRRQIQQVGFPVNAVPLKHIHVSELGRFGRVWMSAAELQRESLGWTVRYGELVSALHQGALTTGLTCWRGVSVVSATESSDVVRMTLSDGREITSRLRVDAEGGLFGGTQGRDTVRDYGQWALVATAHATPLAQQSAAQARERESVAYERFTPEGPLAFLPTAADGSRYAMVWCGAVDQTEQRKGTSAEVLLPQLNRLMGNRIPLTGLSDMASFPLGLNVRSQMVSGRTVSVGNAAQILHPVAGQGLNLGFRDAQALAARLDPMRIEDPVALQEALTAFEADRAPDRKLLVALTDTMARGFATANPVMQAGRQLALLGLEYLPGARRFFAETLMFGWVR